MLSKCVSCIVSKNCEYVSIIAPAVLSTVCVIGIYNMQNVANDIRQQTQYGIRYTENKNKQNGNANFIIKGIWCNDKLNSKMTTYTKSLIQAIMSIGLPEDVLDKIKEYTFPKKISKNDERYNILSKIPQKIYDIEDNVTYVYLNINQDKDYFLTYKNLEIQIQTLLYTDENTIYGTSAHIISIE